MLGRGIALLSGALLLSGCVTAKVGTDHAAISQKIGLLKAGQSRVVVLQQKRAGLSMAICACDVKIDGSPMGKVMVGTYAYADFPAGDICLSRAKRRFRERPRLVRENDARGSFNWQIRPQLRTAAARKGRCGAAHAVAGTNTRRRWPSGSVTTKVTPKSICTGS
ncbi:DUF2846 domain-containing protein [Bradyrhizobium australiense]|uniref:DUF2846 domain-containing protein n=1 Tax=Bradyrhizobium australiense TaxID=2721161 RepID=A0A7Y4GV91_9BRAD|nr:DUF2846 domain-containing protein [Bradyrhizobium australiense]NOJ42624.1 DUF2846 domain-containing protein [Bradyrhizobium australiense]